MFSWIGKRTGKGLVEGIIEALRQFFKELLGPKEIIIKDTIKDEKLVNDINKLMSDAEKISKQAHDILKGRK